MSEEALPVVEPLRAPARTPKGWVVAALALGVCVGVASALAWFPSSPEPERPSTPPRITGPAALAESRFGEGTRPRLDALRDRLVTGLLSLRREDGTWDPAPNDSRFEEVHRTEATAVAIAGLSAAKWMGSKQPGLVDAIATGKAVLAKRQAADGTFGSPRRAASRDRLYSALSFSILAFALAGDPADGATLDRAGAALRYHWGLKSPIDYWTRALAIQAILALGATGHGPSLGPEPKTLIDRRDAGKPDYRDHSVAEAFARAVRDDDVSGFPTAVARLCAEKGADWGGDRTDLYSWLMRAWVCSRVEAGRPWFGKALRGLEEGARERGVIEGDFYGEPVSRTACALLILFEGWTSQRPFGA